MLNRLLLVAGKRESWTLCWTRSTVYGKVGCTIRTPIYYQNVHFSVPTVIQFIPSIFPLNFTESFCHRFHIRQWDIPNVSISEQILFIQSTAQIHYPLRTTSTHQTLVRSLFTMHIQLSCTCSYAATVTVLSTDSYVWHLCNIGKFSLF